MKKTLFAAVLFTLVILSLGAVATNGTTETTEPTTTIERPTNTVIPRMTKRPPSTPSPFTMRLPD
jgi:hypothetical protein